MRNAGAIERLLETRHKFRRRKGLKIAPHSNYYIVTWGRCLYQWTKGFGQPSAQTVADHRTLVDFLGYNHYSAMLKPARGCGLELEG